jgi:HlyD family secretion protein
MRAPPVLAIAAILGIAGGAYFYWSQMRSQLLPAGLAAANGRLEVERVDIASKYAGRVAEIRVREGDSVKKTLLHAWTWTCRACCRSSSRHRPRCIS